MYDITDLAFLKYAPSFVSLRVTPDSRLFAIDLFRILLRRFTKEWVCDSVLYLRALNLD